MSDAAQKVSVQKPSSPAKELNLFEAEPYFAMRTPAFPVTHWLDRLDRFRDCTNIARALQREWQSPWVREAIFLASPSLHKRLSDWDGSITDKKGRKLLHSLYSYYSRMCTRPTPYGLFAAVGCGQVGDATCLDITSCEHDLHRHTRLDTASVAALAERLGELPELRERLKLRPNDCGHAHGDRWQYVEWTQGRDARHYALSAADLSDPLREILALVDPGGTDFAALAGRFHQQHPDIELEEINEFIGCLIDNKLLVTSLEPMLTGQEGLPALLQELKRMEPGAPSLSVLQALRRMLAELDELGPGRTVSDYAAIEGALKPLCANLNRKELFQVDLYRQPQSLRISRSLAQEVAVAAELSLTLGAARNDRLDAFCERFNARYEGRRVGLLEVLDEESGIGEGRWMPSSSPLLDGVAWQSTGESRRPDVDSILMEKLLATGSNLPGEIEISPDDVPRLSGELRSRVPATAHAMVTLLGKSAEAIDRGEGSIWLQGIGGPGVANMLGRFCFGNPELSEHIRASHRREASTRPEAVHAEIVHLPRERMGNLACRPLLREYEIPLLGRSGADQDHQISLHDLEIEVAGKEIVLWSRRLNRPVVPRMSNAHNFEHNTLGIYRFLCLLQHHGTTSGAFSVGPYLKSRARVPRVRCGRVILAPARWNIDRHRARALIEPRSGNTRNTLAGIRAELDIPRHVGLVKADNVLALDLDNELSIDILLAQLRKQSGAELIEMFFAESDLFAGNGSEQFTHELIVPLQRKFENPERPQQTGNKAARTRNHPKRFLRSASPHSSQVPDRVRTRLPGSDWLSYRLFGGAALLDRALAELLAPAANQWQQEGLCTGWFFIRYNDPGWHLRLRFHGRPEDLSGQLIARMRQVTEKLMRQGMIERVDIATYQREIERYGGPGAIGLCERWFAQESRRIAALLGHIRSGDPNWRWQLAILCQMQDLADFGFDPDKVLELFEFVADGFRREFGMEKGRLATLGKKYRALTEPVCSVCRGELPDGLPEPDRLRAVIREGAEERRSIASELRRLDQQGKLWGTVESLLPSFLHMACNRWFIDTSRPNEMVLYELVRRGLTSLRAQAAGPWSEGRDGPARFQSAAR